jgi:soluble lytic murein transglycosylase-like protein
MRRLLTRRHIGLCTAGLLAIGLGLLGALQPSLSTSRSAAVELALLRHLASASATPAAASPAPTSTPLASPTATPASTAIPSSMPVAAEPSVASPTPNAVPPAAAPPPTPVPVVATPASAGPSYSQQDIEAILTAAAQADGVDPSWLISTAQCESNLNAYAYNPSGPYDGLLQFLPSTFAAHGGTDIWDPNQQAQIAASMFAAGESGAWPVCSHR